MSEQDIQLIKIGRHFLSSQVILGRNKKENEIIESKKTKGIKIIPEQPGPTALIQDKKLLDKAKQLIQKYSKHKIKNWKIED